MDVQILNQIRKDGIGSDLFLEGLANDGEVRMHALVSYCFAQSNGFSIIKFLCKHFEYVQMLEYCGGYYKLRVPKSSTKSIGYLFGMIETVNYTKKYIISLCEASVQHIRVWRSSDIT